MAGDFYGTDSGALAYLNDRGYDWNAALDLRLAALTRASQYIDNRYSGKWLGTRTDGRTQPLAWPRTDAEDVEGNEIPDDEVPVEVEHATYEAALRELASPGSLSPDYSSTSSQQVKRKRVDVIEIEYSENTQTAGNIRPIISVIDELLANLIGPRSDTTIGFLLRA